MNISVEITFTPLHNQETPLSTQLYGSYDALMPFLIQTIKTALEKEEKGIMHLKVFNSDRSDYVSDF